jgi:hypothetical protein
MTRLHRNPYDPPAAQLDGIATYDLIRRPISAFHENIGVARADDCRWRVLVKDDDDVHTLERRQDLRSLRLRSDRPLRTFVSTHRVVGIQAHDEGVAERTRLLEISDVTRVEEIEYSVRKNNNASGALMTVDPSDGVCARKHTGVLVTGVHPESPPVRVTAIPSEKCQ